MSFKQLSLSVCVQACNTTIQYQVLQMLSILTDFSSRIIFQLSKINDKNLCLVKNKKTLDVHNQKAGHKPENRS